VEGRVVEESSVGLLKRELGGAIEQQTATSEILRVISISPSDVQPVFDAIAENAATLCGAEFCFVFRFDGELLHPAASHGVSREGIDAVRGHLPPETKSGQCSGTSLY
jgi:two-component system NtrC family sensor kinase